MKNYYDSKIMSCVSAYRHGIFTEQYALQKMALICAQEFGVASGIYTESVRFGGFKQELDKNLNKAR